MNRNRKSISGFRWLALAVLAGSGCYTFQPATEVHPGLDVRTRLNVEASLRRSQGLDEPIRYIDGRVVEHGSESLSLDILIARSPSVFQDIEMRDTVTIMNSEIESILQRKLSVGRSVLVTAAVVGGAVAVVAGINAVVGGTEEPPDDGNQTIVVPIFSFPSFPALRILGFPLRR
jgi:hypothetical protein